MDGVIFKGRFFPVWGGLYTQMSNNPSFIRGGLENISRTIKAEMADAGVVTEETNKDMGKIYRIRKLVPRECGRLMGCSDEDISLIENYPLVPDGNGGWVAPEGVTMADVKKLSISESQQYRMYGNSIVVPVLEAIFTQMFREDEGTLF